jgi:hypothetical protein
VLIVSAVLFGLAIIFINNKFAKKLSEEIQEGDEGEE